LEKETFASSTDSYYDQLRQNLEDKYENLLANATAEEKEELQEKKEREKNRLEAQYQIDYKFNTTWQAYDTFNMSIGQGYNDYSVLQLANYVATIANGGYRMQPYLVSKIVSNEGKVIKKNQPKVVKEVDVDAKTIAETKKAMLAVAQPGGTANFLFSDFPADIKVGAKTGTAQTGRAGDNQLKEFHGVFVAFAPFDDPEIAFAGVVEYGYSGSGSAGLIARDVFRHYFNLDKEQPRSSQENIDLMSNNAGE
jgi:penicillin-binding protein 2